VQVFRREHAPYETANFTLHGLKEDTMYAFTDIDSDETTTFSGKEILQNGWFVTMSQKRSAKIYKYTEVKA
jgi:hypothetical protein